MVGSFDADQKANSRVAFNAGLLISVFTFSEFLSGFAWARASDTIGGRPVLLLGGAAATLLAFLFGICKSLPVAIIIRAMGGLLDPNNRVVQTCVRELVQEKSLKGKRYW